MFPFFVFVDDIDQRVYTYGKSIDRVKWFTWWNSSNYFEILNSLIGVNKRLDSIFTSNLSLMKHSSNKSIYHSLPDPILERFCLQIWPSIIIRNLRVIISCVDHFQEKKIYSRSLIYTYPYNYSHLTTLYLNEVHVDYVEQFLLDTKMYLSNNVCLSCSL